MSFETIKVINFRNLRDQEIYTDYENICLIGDNGQGKTNFIESVYLSSIGSSFRTKDERSMIRTDVDSCIISSKYKGKTFNKIQIEINRNCKTIFLDDKRIRDRKELINISPTIVFSHDDYRFVSGTNDLKRWFYDQSICLINSIYLDELRNYKKLLKMRNILLKKRTLSLLECLDIQLVNTGWELMKQRVSLIEVFSKILGKLFFEITGIDKITIKYLPSWSFISTDEIMALLIKSRNNDLLFGTTCSGPHRDKYEYYKAGKIFSELASTGQKRLLSLLLRVAQASCLYMNTMKKPIILLDDVLLELDPEKRALFLKLLPPYSQAYFSFLPEEKCLSSLNDNTGVYFVQNGMLINEKS